MLLINETTWHPGIYNDKQIDRRLHSGKHPDRQGTSRRDCTEDPGCERISPSGNYRVDTTFHFVPRFTIDNSEHNFTGLISSMMTNTLVKTQYKLSTPATVDISLRNRRTMK